MANPGAQDKTEKPTSKRRTKARSQGQVAKSAELTSVAVMLAGLVSLYMLGGFFFTQISMLLRHFLNNLGQIHLDGDTAQSLSLWVMTFFFKITLPVMGAVVLAAFLENFRQVGFLIAPSRIKLEFSRLNPITGFGRFVKLRVLVDLAKNLAKLGVVGGVAYNTMAAEWPNLPHLADMDLMAAMSYVVTICLRLFWRCLLAMFVLALLDYFYQKWDFENNLKMSKQEVKDEHKQSEGDPQVKSRIRSIQRESARKRMLSAVPDADVVITNPTHYAVALAYKAGEMESPQVVAKGMNLIAEKIKQVARDNDVPIIEDKPLARALYKQVEVGQSIPYEMFETVATILAHVYRSKNQHQQVLEAQRAKA
jgi:flagellar biosynthetic protein FlhB